MFTIQTICYICQLYNIINSFYLSSIWNIKNIRLDFGIPNKTSHTKGFANGKHKRVRDSITPIEASSLLTFCPRISLDFIHLGSMSHLHLTDQLLKISECKKVTLEYDERQLNASSVSSTFESLGHFLSCL